VVAVSGVLNSTLMPYQNTGTTRAAGYDEDILGRDDFLQLLITQLKYQNPLEPMKDTEFISQMAQFSALEQMTLIKEELMQLREDVGKAFEELAGVFESQFDLAARALNMIGKRVKAEAGGEVVEGVVQSIKNFNTIPVLVVEGQEVEVGDVFEVLMP